MSFADPSMFAHEGDLQDWRCRVGRWVDIVKAAHDSGSYPYFKTVCMILGRTQYERGLSAYQQAIVEEAQVQGIIEYKQVENQVAAVRYIVKKVAVGPLLLSSPYSSHTFIK